MIIVSILNPYYFIQKSTVLPINTTFEFNVKIPLQISQKGNYIDLNILIEAQTLT